MRNAWVWLGIALISAKTAFSIEEKVWREPRTPEEMTDMDWERYIGNDEGDNLYPEIAAWFKRATNREMEDEMQKLFDRTKLVFVKYTAIREMKIRNIPIHQYRDFIVSQAKKAIESRDPMECGDHCATIVRYSEVLLPEDAGLILELARLSSDEHAHNRSIALQVVVNIGDKEALEGLRKLHEIWEKDEPARLERVRLQAEASGDFNTEADRVREEESGRRLLAEIAAGIAKMEARLKGGATTQSLHSPERAADSTNAPVPASPSAAPAARTTEAAGPSRVPWILGGILLLLSAATVAVVVARKKRA